MSPTGLDRLVYMIEPEMVTLLINRLVQPWFACCWFNWL